jgi:signal transduction histidine kinase
MKTTAFLIRVAICFLISMIPLTDLENRIYSKRIELRGHSRDASGIVILELEAEDYKTLKRRFSRSSNRDSRGELWTLDAAPGGSARADRLEGLRDLYYWDPHLFRESLRNILGLDPRLVVVTWPIPPEVVESLSDPGVELLARNPKIAWATQFDPEGKLVAPPASLSTRSNFGFVNFFPDSDGEVRRSLLVRHGHPSLTRVADVLAESQPKRKRRLTDPYLINFAGPPGSIPQCRLADVLAGGGRAPAPCRDLKGKVVLLARDSERAVTPLGEMTRAEVIANDLDTIVNHRPIYRASLIEQALIILAMILGGAFYIIYYPVLISAIAITGTGVAIVIALFQVVFHLFDVYIPSANIGASLLVTYLVFTGYRLAFQENLQWRSLKQAQYLRELDQMKSNFLSLVSHDLKTPIAKIQAVVERMRREAPQNKELLDSIENSNNELKHYITSILNLSKIESQKVILNKKSNDINRIIQQALKRLRPIATAKSISIEESLEPLFSVECDEDLIRQVLTNLIDNAIKYSPAGQKVIVRSREEEGFIRVEVEDFGPGIPRDQLPLMFRKFSRFLRPMKEQVKGTGLGLYLSKYFIELHGGTIRVRSEEGKGTTFTFTLPLQGEESETILG